MSRHANSWGSRPTHTTDRMRRFTFARDNWTCRRCGYVGQRDGADLRADHIVPLTAGGARTIANTQTLCVPCHMGKTNREALAGRRLSHRRPRRRHPADTMTAPH